MPEWCEEVETFLEWLDVESRIQERAAIERGVSPRVVKLG